MRTLHTLNLFTTEKYTYIYRIETVTLAGAGSCGTFCAMMIPSFVKDAKCDTMLNATTFLQAI
jgi:hypothetical protein